MTPLIRRCRNAYKKGPVAPEAAKFVEILERHQADWLAQAERWMDYESDELAAFAAGEASERERVAAVLANAPLWKTRRELLEMIEWKP